MKPDFFGMVEEMKTLYLMRHAKSDRRHYIGPDIDRPLNKRGRSDAPRMGVALSKQLGECIVVKSPALRVSQTWAGLCDGWPELARRHNVVDDSLYTFDERELWQWLQTQDESMGSGIMIIAHNPALTDLINRLAGYPAIDNLPTAGFVHFSLDVSQWSAISDGCGTIENAILPRQLAD